MLPFVATTPINRIQNRLLNLAALFLGLYCLALTFASTVRDPGVTGYPWTHWIALAVWLVLFNLANIQSARWLPRRDPYLLPIAALLSGWGLLTIFRLYPEFGLRQTAWLAVACSLLIAGLRWPSGVRLLRRYKYLWLTGGLVLTALTLAFGTNPLGYGPQLWLGCCGVYLQPSEPLKLLLIAYLAAYLADRLIAPEGGHEKPGSTSLLPLLTPTLIMTGMALLLLIAQRDLGTASIFLFLYAAIVYIASGRRRILGISLVGLLLAGAVGYLLFDVVQVRIDAWLNPWLDPSGRSYQIVQSLLAVANGGLVGRGPGLGYPGLVPIPHSDFIFSSIMEESGLVGGLVLIILVAFLAVRGIRISLQASDPFRRYLAGGLTAYLAAQSILIIGGNIRLLPLTGVTLPFVSYGGSSLVTSFLSLALLLLISNKSDSQTAALPNSRPYLVLGALLLVGLGATALLTGWWAVYRAPALLSRTDNPRRAISDRAVQRGAILDREGNPIVATTGEAGSYTRQILYPELSNIVGYTNPLYGQSGLEASLDSLLRGLEGNPARLVWWNQLLFGQPPRGVDLRTSLDLELQRSADRLLGDRKGAIVLLDARSGEILAMASHPGFDANHLEENWDALVNHANAPLVNRAAQVLYPIGAALSPLLLADAEHLGVAPAELPEEGGDSDSFGLSCANDEENTTWGEAVGQGCPGATATLGRSIGAAGLLELYQSLGLFSAPQAYLPADSSSLPGVTLQAADLALGKELRLSPLQMALAAAALSSGGLRPPPYLVTAAHSTQGGWVTVPALGNSRQVFSAEVAHTTANLLADGELPFWQSVAVVTGEKGATIWYLGGTLADWGGAPLVVVVALEEEEDTEHAAIIGRELLQEAMKTYIK